MNASSEPPAPPSLALGRSATLDLRESDFRGVSTSGEGNGADSLESRLLAWGGAVQTRLHDHGMSCVCILVHEHGPSTLAGIGGIGGEGSSATAPSTARSMSDPALEPLDGTVRDVSLAFLRSPRDQEVLEKAAVAKGVLAAPSPGSFLGKVREPIADLAIGLSVQPTGLAMHLQLPPAAQVDRANWVTCLAEPARALHLKGALEALPEQFGMHVGREGSVGEARGVTIATLRELLERSGQEKQPLRISWVLPSALALAHVHELGDQLEDAAVALADVYKLVAWAVDNDLLGICDEPTSKAPEAHGREVAARTKGKKSAQREESSRRKGRKKSGTEDASWATEADERESVPDATAEGHAASKPASLPLPPRSNPPRPLRAFGRGGAFRGDEDPKMPIEKGVKVRVRTGPFQNKSGVVQELDGKGSARVLLGLLATWIDVRQLVGCIEGRDRPMLGSSHRKRTSGR